MLTSPCHATYENWQLTVPVFRAENNCVSLICRQQRLQIEFSEIKQLSQFKLISFLSKEVKYSRCGDSVKSSLCIILFVPSQPFLSRELICILLLSGHLTLTLCHGFNFAFSLV